MQNARALVVEDDALSLITISSMLKDLGISFRRNTTGAGVVDQASALRPTFILLNTDLPEGDAIAICKSIRHDPCTRHIPVIAVADEFSPEFLRRIGKDGLFTGHLRKPLSYSNFARVLERAVEEAPQAVRMNAYASTSS